MQDSDETRYCFDFGLSLRLVVRFTSLAADESTLKPVLLRCEYRVDPLGIGVTSPRFSWIVVSSGEWPEADCLSGPGRFQRRTARGRPW